VLDMMWWLNVVDVAFVRASSRRMVVESFSGEMVA